MARFLLSACVYFAVIAPRLALQFGGAVAEAQSNPEEAVSGLMAAWNAKDAQAYASRFTEDATFVNVNGNVFIGKKDIEDRHANAGIFKSSHAELKPESVRLLTPNVALLQVSWTITADARDPEPRSYLMTMVVSKRGGHWLIVAAQNGSAVDRSALPGSKFLPDSPLPAVVPESEGVRKLFTELDNNWSKSEAASFAKLFAEDSDLVDTSTHRFHGRANIEAHFADVLAHSLKGTNSHTTVLTSDPLTPDITVLEVRWQLKGGAQGDTPLTITGLRLVSRTDGNWRIAAAQDTIARPLTAAQNASGTPPPSFEAQKCAALTDLNLETAPGGPAFITSVQLVDIPATGLERPAYAPSGYGSTNGLIQSGRVHRFCDVTGYVAPQNRFELKLPLRSDWNRNFFFTACGGFCGSVVGERCNFALARGYASATGNGGHESSGNGFDAIWGANAPNLQEDFGWRSNHVVTLIAKAITTHYYGEQIKYSYMAGNSKGGQAVLLEAQKFPEDFDGLMPSAPVYDYTGRNVIAAAWFARAIGDGHGGSVLNDAAAQAIHKSVLAQCGAQAGVEEGLVTDPPACKWKPEMIACASGGDATDCLSAKQVAAVKHLMTPVTNSKGEVLWAYPYLPGAETQWVGWNFLGSPSAGLRPRVANLYLPEQYLKYLVDETIRENFDPLKFDFDRDPATLERARRIYDASSFDLRAFKAHGGKILLWHGWADGAIPGTSSIGYYEGVMTFMGGRKQTENFFRLFLIPGVHHGGGGPGLTDFDALTALENWVEKGQAPEKLIASRTANGVVERSRPVFPYPVLARYSGSGDPKQADSFVPFDPPYH